MRTFSQLPRAVVLLEVIGIVQLVASTLALREMLPLPLSGKLAATVLLFTAIGLMLPATCVLMWRTAKIIAPEFFNTRFMRDKRKPGDSDDADH